MNKGLTLFLCLAITIQARQNQPVILVSIPKCGTHLLKKCITLLTGKKSVQQSGRACVRADRYS